MFLSEVLSWFDFETNVRLNPDAVIFSLCLPPRNFVRKCETACALLVFSRRLNKPVDDVVQSERERTKRVVYSIMYGVGTSSLLSMLILLFFFFSSSSSSFSVSFFISLILFCYSTCIASAILYCIGDYVSAFRVKLGANDLKCVDMPLNPTHSLSYSDF